MTVTQSLAAGLDALLALALLVVSVVVWDRRRVEKAALLAAGSPISSFSLNRLIVKIMGGLVGLVVAGVIATICAWPTMGPTAVPASPVQSKQDSTAPKVKIDSPGPSVPRCVTVSGTVTGDLTGYSVVLGEAVLGDVTFYETAVLTGSHWSAQMEVGDRTRKDQYELTANIIKTSEKDVLVDVSQNAYSGKDDITWFGTSKALPTFVAQDSLKVGRKGSNKPCS